MLIGKIEKVAEREDHFFLFDGLNLMRSSESCFEFRLMGIRLYKSLLHYGAADKEGQIVGMRGAARGLHVLNKDDKDVC